MNPLSSKNNNKGRGGAVIKNINKVWRGSLRQVSRAGEVTSYFKYHDGLGLEGINILADQKLLEMIIQSGRLKVVKFSLAPRPSGGS
jgi:hypothetical protein